MDERSSSKSSTEGLLLAGQVGKPHGVGGEVYVLRISDDPHRFEPGSVLVHEDGRTLMVESRRQHRDRFLVKFEGVDDRGAAAALRGGLYVSPEERRTLEQDEFWIDDLLGLEARLPSGESVGEVTGVIEGTAHDHLEVATLRGPRLVPVVKAIVTEVDLEAGSVTIDPPPGLLD